MPTLSHANARSRARRARRHNTTPWLPHLDEQMAELKEQIRDQLRPAPRQPALQDIHQDVRRDNEQGWFVLQADRPSSADAAAADRSDVDDADALVHRDDLGLPAIVSRAPRPAEAARDRRRSALAGARARTGTPNRGRRNALAPLPR